MKKTIKNLLGVALALVMCLTMAPTATAKADEAVALSEYTEEQLLTAFMGEWGGYGGYAELTEEHAKLGNVEYNWDTGEDEVCILVDLDWKYEGIVELEGRELTEEDFDNNMIGMPVDSKTKALKFTGGEYTFYLYVGYDMDFDKNLTIERVDAADEQYFVQVNLKTSFGNEEVEPTIDVVLEAATAESATPKTEEPTVEPTETPVEEPKAEEPTPVPTETPVEEPKTEEPAEDTTADAEVEAPVEDVTDETPVEEPKAEDTTAETPVEDTTTETETPAVETEDNKEVIEKTKDGREVYTGEQIYIVKKGDSLWKIAKELLGNGKRYKELFTRNNGVVEKATLIFPRQEIIVPAK